MAYKFNPFTGQFDDSPGLVTSTNAGLLPAGFSYENDVFNVPGDINLDDGVAEFETTLQTITPTADRTISFPDASGTVALIGGTNGQITYNNAGAQAGISTLTTDGTNLTLDGRLINTYTSLADAPAKVFTGSWFTGGTPTTTKPHFLIEPAGTTSTAWSTAGTGLGVNAASGFAGRLLDLQLNGTSRAVVTGAGNVGIGTTSPSEKLSVVNGSIQIESSTTGGSDLRLKFKPGFSGLYGNQYIAASNAELRIGASTVGGSNSVITFYGRAGTEQARIDSSGRLLVGTSTARQTGGGFTAQSQVEGSTTVSASSFTITSNRSADDLGPRLNFARSKGGAIGSNTIVDADAEYGGIYFFGADGTDTDSIGAQISAYVDGTPGANDMPGRLVFSTTADGASSPTERMMITSDAYVRLAAGTGGIQFNGDTAAANALDDYEEGTWTPLPDAVGAITQPIYTSSGLYLKIGKLVYLTGNISVTTASTGAVSQSRITGIPFNMGGSGSGLADYQPQFTVGAYSAVSSSAADSSTPTGAYVYEFAIFLRSLFGSTAGGQVNHGWSKVGVFNFSLTYYLL